MNIQPNTSTAVTGLNPVGGSRGTRYSIPDSNPKLTQNNNSPALFPAIFQSLK